jgi:acyl-CoA oxidase
VSITYVFSFSEPEPQIIDYLTQQYKLFPNLAACFALRFNAIWLWNMYNCVTAELEDGDLDRLPEVCMLVYEILILALQ